MKVGLPGNQARDQADVQERIRAIELVPMNGTAYCLHVATDCLAFIEGVRILIIKLNKTMYVSLVIFS